MAVTPPADSGQTRARNGRTHLRTRARYTDAHTLHAHAVHLANTTGDQTRATQSTARDLGDRSGTPPVSAVDIG